VIGGEWVAIEMLRTCDGRLALFGCACQKSSRMEADFNRPCLQNAGTVTVFP